VTRKLLLASVLLLLAYLLWWPVPVDPVVWKPLPNPGYNGAFAPNTELAKAQRIGIAGTHGPEALARGPDGLVYSSTHEGWIIRHDPAAGTTTRWVNTGGRPLGLAFDRAGQLLVADAYRGLLGISPAGDISVLADAVDGAPIRYADDVDVAPDGRVYFSDASSKFGAQQYGGTYPASLLDLMEHGDYGRVLVYDPEQRKTQVLVEGLSFANGVAVAEDGAFLLVNETGRYRVLKVFLRGPRAGEMEPLIEALPGFPDNVVRGGEGRFWVGLVSPRLPVLDRLATRPWLRRVVQRLPAALKPAARHYGHVFAVNGEGRVLTSLQDPAGGFHTTTGALEADGWLYISSLAESSLARLPWPPPAGRQ
jgi:sugar lactone lactonase YvrE